MNRAVFARRRPQGTASAFENRVGVAMANYATSDVPQRSPGDANGRSVAFSGVCYQSR
jgi:hypothetical protein